MFQDSDIMINIYTVIVNLKTQRNTRYISNVSHDSQNILGQHTLNKIKQYNFINTYSLLSIDANEIRNLIYVRLTHKIL